METQYDSQDGCAFASPHGRLDFSSALPFQKELDEVIANTDEGTKAFIIDCAALEYVSSAGLRAFLTSARAAEKKGIGFAVCGLIDAVREVFEVSNFSRVIKIVETRDDAVREVGGA